MSFKVQGWCPGALRPMESGDGLVVRIRPRLARLSVAQGQGLATAALSHGNGQIEVTARANIQLRGVTQASHEPLLAVLADLDLLDASEADERRRNVVVTPFWQTGDATETVARTLYNLLKNNMNLPGKFGFSVDLGAASILGATSADIRLERDQHGQIILRADGALGGQLVTAEMAADQALAMAGWFLASGGKGRMAAHLARAPLPFDTAHLPRTTSLPGPGPNESGALVGLEFGIIRAERFGDLASRPLRITPWRMLLVEGAVEMPRGGGLIGDAADPRLRVSACTGAPGCPQALQKTRSLARLLAPSVPLGKTLHVSGCGKGCAHPGPADLTLTGTPKGFGLVRNGRAGDLPERVIPASDVTLDTLAKAL